MKHKGFTLIETLVALSILAVVAISASQASRSYLQSVSNMKTRVLAQFVANNVLTDLRLQKKWLTQTTSQQIDEQGRQWQVTVTPSDTNIDSLKKIRIVVAPINDGVAGQGVVTLDAVLTKSMGTL